MNPLIEGAFDILQKEVQRYLETADCLREVVQSLDSLPSYVEVHPSMVTHDVYLNLPYDLRKLAETRRSLGRAWRHTYGFSLDDGTRIIHYRSRSFKAGLTIRMSSEALGPACRLEKVGEKVVPLMKVVCA